MSNEGNNLTQAADFLQKHAKIYKVNVSFCVADRASLVFILRASLLFLIQEVGIDWVVRGRNSESSCSRNVLGS